jgi:radical SAM protein with 4Fe4S-binding SPASM domain
MKEFLRKAYYKNRHFKNRKLENYLFEKDDLRLLSLQQKIHPHIALVEITKSCNLRCEYCPNKSSADNNVFMDFAVYKSIIDQLPPDIELQPVGLGESSLHPDFPEMIEYASSRNKFKLISVTTNLTAKKSDYYSNLFEKGMNFLSFSIDTFNPLTILNTRAGTDTERLIFNIRMVTRQFPDSTSAHLTLSDKNLPDLEDTIEKLIESGVRRMTMKNVIKFNSETNPDISTLNEEVVSTIIGKYNDQIDIKLVQTEKCTRPFNEIAVNVYGNLFFCHYSFINDNWGFGKIQNDLMKKYYSDEFNLLRTTFYRKRSELCTFCPYYPIL